MLIDFFGTQVSVGFSLAIKLALVRFCNTSHDCTTFFARCLMFHQFLLRYDWNFDLHIDAVE